MTGPDIPDSFILQCFGLAIVIWGFASKRSFAEWKRQLGSKTKPKIVPHKRLLPPEKWTAPSRTAGPHWMNY